MITLAAFLAACSFEPRGLPPGDAGGSADPGALVRLTMHSQVGVLLDEIPEDMRDRVAEALLDEGPALWRHRARYQIDHATLQLPMPPGELWNITFDPDGPERTQITGHDMIVIGYTLDATLLGDAASLAEAKPALARAGGTWEESFIVPMDPMFLLQRTGYACINETNAVFEENARFSFDYTCEVETPDAIRCHRRPDEVQESCIEALDRVVGKVQTSMRFERLAWDPALADSVRVGMFTRRDVSDLQPSASALKNHWLVYRYIPEDSCAVVERCVTGTGWRRLLMFNASVINVGGADMKIGQVDEGLGSELVAHNVYEYSACHGHYHFRFYGDFRYGTDSEQIGKKQAFCLQSSARHFNNEDTSFTTDFGDCAYQGISAGWGDIYEAGIDCQWLDITDIDIPGASVTQTLSFQMNPDEFLCEGTPVQDAEGRQQFEPTSLETEQGEPIDRPLCEQAEGWDANNLAQREIEIPKVGSFIHQPCPPGALGPHRDCGFAGATTHRTCTAGETVTMTCNVPAGTPPQVARFCEVSHALGTGVPCASRESVASTIVTATSTEITFSCPPARDGDEDAGGYAMYTAPLHAADELGQVTCAREW